MRKTMTGVALLAVVLLTGCTNVETPLSTPAPSTEPAVESAVSPEEEGAAAEGAEEVAVATLTAFLDHERPQDEWWADFSQSLSPEALYVWEGVRADRVTATAITGDAIVSVASDRFVSVILPTGVGSYRFDMAKRVEQHTSDGVWLVFEMTAPVTG